MRVLLTGASGFIGSHVLRALLGGDHEVGILAMPEDPLRRISALLPRVTLIRGTLGGLSRFSEILSAWRPEGCIHLAWYVEPGRYLHAQENTQCLMESLQLIRTVAACGCGRVVGAGTCAEYDARLAEDHIPTMYAAAKLACCLLGRALAQQLDIQFAWARISYPYGPHEDPRRAVPALIHALLSGHVFPATPGTQVRDCVHVEDVASAFVLLLEKGASGIFDIASGVPVTVRQLMETVGAECGKRELIRFGALTERPGDPSGVGGNCEPLRALGWTPRYTLAEGLRQTIAWWKANFTEDDSPAAPRPASMA